MQSIYEAIGGQAALEAAVERFYQRAVADPLLGPFFKGMDMRRLKAHQIAFLGQAIGGPFRYEGAGMQRAHAHLRIERRHFDAVAEHLSATLREFRVPTDMIAGILERIGGLAGQIVNTPEATATAAGD